MRRKNVWCVVHRLSKDGVHCVENCLVKKLHVLLKESFMVNLVIMKKTNVKRNRMSP